MKQGLDSSTKSYPNQLVVPHASLEAIKIPKYAWIMMVLIAMALLAVTAMYRQRERLNAAQASHQYTQQRLQDRQTSNQLLRKDIEAMKQDKNVIAQEAQNKLNYVRPNEVVVFMR